MSAPCVLAARERVEREARGVGARLARHHAGAGALAPDFELIDGRGAKGVAGHQHHALAFGAEFGGELADGGGLAGAVDAGDQNDEGPRRDLQRLGDRDQHFLDLAGQQRLHLVRRDGLVEAAFAKRRGDAAGEFRPEIGADQFVFQLLHRRGIELALGHQIGDRAAERRRGALEPAAQAFPPALSVCCRSCCARDSRFGMTPEEMLARLLYRDGLMLVIDKPAGFAVHRGPKGGESLEDYFDALRFGLPRNPALAHRLDKDTSGCLVLGRHRKALALLGKLFKQGKIGKTYWAVVEGAPDADEGRIDMPLGKLDEDRGWWMKPDPHGAAGVDDMEGDGPRRRPHVARARAADRPHASVARALRRDGLADSRRQYLWPRAAQFSFFGRTAAASAFARDRGADFQEQAAGRRHRAGARAYARGAERVRVEGRR